MKMSTSTKYLTAQEACRLLGLSTHSASDKLSKGRLGALIPVVKRNTTDGWCYQNFYRIEDVVAYLTLKEAEVRREHERLQAGLTEALALLSQ